MPNRDLTPFVNGSLARIRYPTARVGGQTVRGEPDVATDLRAIIRPEVGTRDEAGYGTFPGGAARMKLDPEADVLAGDTLYVTAGPYLGQSYRVLPIVAHPTLIPCVALTAELLPEP